jgi:penicillin amidase
VPGIPSGVGPLPQSGDHTTVKQVSGNLGPSQRFTADLNSLDNSTENILVGQSGDPRNSYFRDQWPFWYGGRTFKLPFSDGAVRDAAQHTLHLVP